MLPYRLAAIDLDDTLLGPDKAISRENAEAVRRLQEAGVHCVLASGRRHENMLRFHRQLDLSGPIVSCNGACVKVAENGETWHEIVMPADLAETVIQWGDELGVAQNYYHTDGNAYVRERDRWVQLYETRTGSLASIHDPLEDFGGESALKILWIDEPQRILTLRDRARERFGERLYITITDPEYLEFMAPGVNKAHGLATVAERHGIEGSQVVAFGDGNNDVEMLAWAGLGVAMSHGRPAARAAANRVAPSGSPETELARAIGLLFDPGI
ncbi:MAG: Cof-type HAD-IIB family hydrolase [Capsulimonadales bacterium]|nr:Cof-type HAD-IIB family hydrolase [Capsulimonadales bacterium]